MRARKAHHEGALQHAEHASTELLALDPEHPEALHLLGAVRFQQGRLGDAEPLMRRSIEHRPVPLALANYAAVLTGPGGSTTRSRVDEALAINPVHQRVLFQRAGLLGQLARYDACMVYDRLLELTPGFADGYVKRSDTLRALGRRDEALADCDRSIALAGRSFEAMRGRGLALRELGRFRDAVDSMATRSRRRPAAPKCCSCAVSRISICTIPSARSRISMRRSRRFPTFIDAIFNSSIALEQLERHDEALVRCDRVLAIDPRHARALANAATRPATWNAIAMRPTAMRVRSTWNRAAPACCATTRAR